MPTTVAQVQLRDPDPKKKGPCMAKDTYAVVRAAALATHPAKALGPIVEPIAAGPRVTELDLSRCREAEPV